nr:CPBP family intramembrane glutamic endopeptidase [Desulfobaculum xiamenense]
MWVGLFVVSIVEEIVFRGLAWTALSSVLGTSGWAVAASAVVYGLSHWSLGPAEVCGGIITGAALTLCMWRTDSVYPLIAAQFLMNVLYIP